MRLDNINRRLTNVKRALRFCERALNSARKHFQTDSCKLPRPTCGSASGQELHVFLDLLENRVVFIRREVKHTWGETSQDDDGKHAFGEV